MFSFIIRFSSSVSHNWVGGFFTRFPFLNRQLPYSTELASKREGNYNVIVTRPTNYIILTRDPSNDLVTWSRQVTYELHPDIKTSSILIFASLFPCYDYVWLFFIIKAHVFSLLWTLSRCLEVLLLDPSGSGVIGSFPRSLLMKATGGLTSRLTPIQDPVVVLWEGSPQLLLIKATGRSHGEWWAVRLAGRSLSLTLEDVNISFNHSSYYSMSRGKGKVVIDKWWAW